MKLSYFLKEIEKHTVILALVNKKKLNYKSGKFWPVRVGTHTPNKVSFFLQHGNWDTLHYGNLPKKLSSKIVVGFAVIGEEFKRKVTMSVVVRKDYRRKGVATGMYNYYEASTGFALKPSCCLTENGEEFWYARKQVIKNKK